MPSLGILSVDLRLGGQWRREKDDGKDNRAEIHRQPSHYAASFAISSIASGWAVVIVSPVIPHSAHAR